MNETFWNDPSSKTIVNGVVCWPQWFEWYLFFIYLGILSSQPLQPRPGVANLFKSTCQTWLNHFKNYPCMPLKILHSVSLFLLYTFYLTNRSKKWNKTLYHCISGTWSCAGHDWKQRGFHTCPNFLHLCHGFTTSGMGAFTLPFDRAVESEGCT